MVADIERKPKYVNVTNDVRLGRFIAPSKVVLDDQKLRDRYLKDYQQAEQRFEFYSNKEEGLEMDCKRKEDLLNNLVVRTEDDKRLDEFPASVWEGK